MFAPLSQRHTRATCHHPAVHEKHDVKYFMDMAYGAPTILTLSHSTCYLHIALHAYVALSSVAVGRLECVLDIKNRNTADL